MRLTCWSDQGVVQSGQGAGLPLSQPHSDLLLDPPGFGPRVRRRAVRGNHVCGAGRGRLQSRQKAALRHGYTHLWSWFGPLEEQRSGLRAAERRARWMNASAPVSAVKWRLVGLEAGPAGLGGRHRPPPDRTAHCDCWWSGIKMLASVPL